MAFFDGQIAGMLCAFVGKIFDAELVGILGL